MPPIDKPGLSQADEHALMTRLSAVAERYAQVMQAIAGEFAANTGPSDELKAQAETLKGEIEGLRQEVARLKKK